MTASKSMQEQKLAALEKVKALKGQIAELEKSLEVARTQRDEEIMSRNKLVGTLDVHKQELRRSKTKTKTAYQIAAKFEELAKDNELKLQRALGYIDRITEGEKEVVNSSQPWSGVETQVSCPGPKINEVNY